MAGKRLLKVRYIRHDKERQYKEPPVGRDERGAFERDRSRIIHSAAFRRLQGKTQVFAVTEGDFYRTRLTHSLEVAQIAKGIALRLGANPDLAETVSLIHDLGHPPFGHAGESELKSLMEPFGGFEANGQNLRIIAFLERKSPDYRGLNLTRATIDGQLKYKTPYPQDKDKFFYAENEELVSWASQGAHPDSKTKSFECQIMEWADDLAYAVHDLEDGLRANFITVRDLYYDTDLHDIVRSNVEEELIGRYPDSAPTSKELKEIFANLQNDMREINPDFRMEGVGGKPSRVLRSSYRKLLTSFLIKRFIRPTERGEQSGASCARYRYRVQIPSQIRAEQLLLNNLVYELVMKSPSVMTLEEKGRKMIRDLFNLLRKPGKAEALLPKDWAEDLLTAQAGRERVIADYISGMTDNYAQRMYQRLFLPFSGSVYEVL